jgi:hypothetical protein
VSVSRETSPEPEVSETFTLLRRSERLDPDALPRSPKSTFRLATECGWMVHAWLAVGEYAPTLYVSNSDEDDKHPHSIGDVLYDGYRANIYVVEARDPELPLGFKASYIGKEYEDGRSAPAGSFDHALIVDPVGIPHVLKSVYKPIKQDRGKYETTKSFSRRLADAQKMADEQDRLYNTGEVIFQHRRMFTAARPFDSWLAEWRSFYQESIPL